MQLVSALFVALISLSMRRDSFCMLPAVHGQRLADAYLALGEMAFFIPPGVTLVAIVGFNHFSLPGHAEIIAGEVPLLGKSR